MKYVRLALVAAMALPAPALLTAPAAAQTQTQADCEAQIASLRTASGSVTISGKNADKDRAGLTNTLSAASTELAKGKNADAAKKLADFKVKVGQLLEAGRISSGDASSLTAQADAAIACVNGLSAS